MASEGDPQIAKNRTLILAVILLVLFMKIPLYQHVPVDWDEGVYIYLSENMGWSLNNYSLKGSHFEEELSHRSYSAPLYHHPPLVPYLIKAGSLFAPPLKAAKLINFALSFLSLFLVYGIGALLAGETAGLVALSLWVLCPVFNLESTLVHLDFPMTVFFLLGVWLVLLGRGRAGGGILLLGGAAFALAMLSKYTGPLYFVVPVALVLGGETGRRSWKLTALFFLLLGLGWSWYPVVLAQYGTLMPPELIGNREGGAFVSPYLRGIGRREWYHLWLYFLCICPLFVLYIGGALRMLLPGKGGRAEKTTSSGATKDLIILNLATIFCVIVFSLVNLTNGYWIMRHIMPIYPVIYITLGVIVAGIWRRGEMEAKVGLAVLLFFNTAFMGASTFVTMQHVDTLRPVPALLLWIPEMRTLFY